MRQEPTIGTKITSFFGQNKTLDHNLLVENALEAFTKAEQGMTEAINLIDADIKLQEELIKETEKKISDAEGSKNRLTRTLDRLKAFTA
jgi:hypothetical protein